MVKHSYISITTLSPLNSQGEVQVGDVEQHSVSVNKGEITQVPTKTNESVEGKDENEKEDKSHDDQAY